MPNLVLDGNPVALLIHHAYIGDRLVLRRCYADPRLQALLPAFLIHGTFMGLADVDAERQIETAFMPSETEAQNRLIDEIKFVRGVTRGTPIEIHEHPNLIALTVDHAWILKQLSAPQPAAPHKIPDTETGEAPAGIAQPFAAVPPPNQAGGDFSFPGASSK